MHSPYPRFLVMILVSTTAMFGLMYFNTYAWDHVFWSETRFYMALLMGSAMALIMLTFMWSMYTRPAVNAVILAGAAVVFASSLWLVRSQSTIEDVAWMKAMIPHHSIAILTSERARISDPRARSLADAIVETQRSEIREMENLIRDLGDG